MLIFFAITVVIIASFITLSMLIFYFCTKEGKARRKLHGAKRTAIADIQEGTYLKLVGEVRFNKEQPLTSPISQLSCYYWNILVKENTGLDRNLWKKLFETSKHHRELLLEDSTGQVHISLEEAQPVMTNAEDFWPHSKHEKLALIDHFFSDNGHALKDSWGNIRKIHLAEWTLQEGQKAAVIGTARREGTTVYLDPGDDGVIHISTDPRLHK